MAFNGIQWRTKAEITRDKLDADIAFLTAEVAVLEKKIFHRVFLRNAGLEEMRNAKKAHAKATRELNRLKEKAEGRLK